MTQFYYIVKFIFPFLLILTFSCLYKKDYRFMKKFYWKMAMSANARKLYTIGVFCVLMLIHFCSYMTDINPNCNHGLANNYAVYIAFFMTMCIVWYKVAGSIFHLLQEKIILKVFTIILTLVCFAIPYMNSEAQVLFGVFMASYFYPSRYVLELKNDPKYATNHIGLLNMILKNYY